ncbi:MAG: monophosphatase [Actinomycetota bacterium]|nr:monophosphatase [Actinomycetota bacterium]
MPDTHPLLSSQPLVNCLDRCRELTANFQASSEQAHLKHNIHGSQEVVTDVDLRIQELIGNQLETLWPEIPLVGEENRDSLGPLPADCFVLDPIDGTAPFLDGSPFYAIALCLVRSGSPAAAVIDLSAYRIRVSATPTALHVIGNIDALPRFPLDSVLTSPRHKDITRHMLSGLRPPRTTRAVPTTTVKMVLVALGRARTAIYPSTADGYAAPWDYAAAALTVAASGGRVVDDTGRDLARTLPRVIHSWQADAAGQPVVNLLWRS